VTGIGYILQYAVNESLAGTWKPGYKAFGLAMGPQASAMVICGATPEMKAKLLDAEKAIREGKIKVLEG
jgi:basic membrane protein A